MSRPENPYAPTESTHDRLPAGRNNEAAVEPRKRFRWQILPCRFNALFALVCVVLIIVEVQLLADLFSRWHRS